MAFRLVRAALAAWLLVSWQGPARAADDDAGPAFVAAKLRTHCAACHAVGRMRFIWSDDDLEVWNYILANRAPISGKLWGNAIIEVLSWPTDNAPPFDQLMDPSGNRDWMPKGVKRLDLAADRDNGRQVRHMIIETLHAALGE